MTAHHRLSSEGMKAIVMPWSMMMGFSIPGAVRIVVGFYPAKSATPFDPIKALRHEWRL